MAGTFLLPPTHVIARGAPRRLPVWGDLGHYVAEFRIDPYTDS